MASSTEQVRAQDSDKSVEKAESNQMFAGNSGSSRSRAPSLAVKAVSTTTKRRRKKRGGWKQSKGLRWSQVQQVYELRKLADEAGTPLNWVVDIHATDDALRADDRACKRRLSNVTKNIQQAVKGRGKQPRQAAVPCVTVYEKRLGGDLHAHMWLHRAPGNDALDRFHDGAEINVHRAHTKTADYLTKSRLPRGDAETEATFPHKRQGGQAAIRGSRITFNADAKALLAAGSKGALATAAALKPATDRWAAPVLGWREGELKLQNIVRDEAVTIQLRAGALAPRDTETQNSAPNRGSIGGACCPT